MLLSLSLSLSEPKDAVELYGLSSGSDSTSRFHLLCFLWRSRGRESDSSVCCSASRISCIRAVFRVHWFHADELSVHAGEEPKWNLPVRAVLEDVIGISSSLSLYQMISDASFRVPSDCKAHWSVAVLSAQTRSSWIMKVTLTFWTTSEHCDMQPEMWKCWQTIFTNSRQSSKNLGRSRHCAKLNAGWINRRWKEFDLLKVLVDIMSSRCLWDNYWGSISVWAIQPSNTAEGELTHWNRHAGGTRDEYGKSLSLTDSSESRLTCENPVRTMALVVYEQQQNAVVPEEFGAIQLCCGVAWSANSVKTKQTGHTHEDDVCRCIERDQGKAYS